MLKEDFVKILSNTIQQRMLIYCVMFLFAIILLVAGVRGFRAKQPPAKKLTTIMLCALFLIVYLLVIACPNLLSIQKDIENTQIVSIEGFYNFDATSTSKRSLFGRVYISAGEESFSLELPANWDPIVFPEGKYYGVIYYGENSKIIVGFQPMNYEEIA